MDDWHLRFFDEVLKGHGSGVFASPARVFVLHEGWRDLDGWPPSGSTTADWYLRSGGRANSAYGDGILSTEAPAAESADVFLYDPMMPSTSLGGHSCCTETIAPMGPADQEAYEASKGVLVYTTPPFGEDLVLLGDASVELFACSSALDTDFTARLCVVDEAGVSTNLKEGIVRAASATHSRLLPFSSPASCIASRFRLVRSAPASRPGSGSASTSRALTSRSGIAT